MLFLQAPNIGVIVAEGLTVNDNGKAVEAQKIMNNEQSGNLFANIFSDDVLAKKVAERSGSKATDHVEYSQPVELKGWIGTEYPSYKIKGIEGGLLI